MIDTAGVIPAPVHTNTTDEIQRSKGTHDNVKRGEKGRKGTKRGTYTTFRETHRCKCRASTVNNYDETHSIITTLAARSAFSDRLRIDGRR